MGSNSEDEQREASFAVGRGYSDPGTEETGSECGEALVHECTNIMLM